MPSPSHHRKVLLVLKTTATDHAYLADTLDAFWRAYAFADALCPFNQRGRLIFNLARVQGAVYESVREVHRLPAQITTRLIGLLSGNRKRSMALGEEVRPDPTSMPMDGKSLSLLQEPDGSWVVSILVRDPASDRDGRRLRLHFQVVGRGVQLKGRKVLQSLLIHGGKEFRLELNLGRPGV